METDYAVFDDSQECVEQAEAAKVKSVFAGQARLLAQRAERDLPVTSGSLARLVELGSRLDAELLEERE